VAWRRRGASRDGTRGFQLWIALPPELELGPSVSLYQGPRTFSRKGPARVLLGRYGSATSAIAAPSPINYLAVHLKQGERWRYQPPQGHTVLWIAVSSGAVAVPDTLRQGDLAAFEPSNEAIEVEAQSDAELSSARLFRTITTSCWLLLGAHQRRRTARGRAGSRRSKRAWFREGRL